MDEVKPTLTSKTVITNLLLAVLNALVFFGVIASDAGIGGMIAAGSAQAAINVVGNLLAAWFRKNAVAKLV